MPDFKLTKSYVFNAFAPLQETSDLALRNTFFSDAIVSDIKWTITGSAHSLAGTRYNLKDHAEKSFNRLGKRLVGPIKFIVTSVIVDAERSDDGWWACVETRGEATRKTGLEYNNEYVWLTRFNDEGKIVEIRSYFDTMLSEEVLAGPE